ncbi:MAG: SelB C-terminal domain-containing protein, partial [Clostridia bacterium]|nr:SelB C-terminal domain-containing protein [Clostridia bacterium]
SPVETIGGGVILDDSPAKHRRGDKKVLAALKIMESGSDDQKLAQSIAEEKLKLPDATALAKKLGTDPEDLTHKLNQIANRGLVVEVLPGRYIAASALDEAWDRCQKLLEGYHKQNPLHAGIKRAELRQKLFPRVDMAAADAVLSEFTREGKLARADDRYALSSFKVVLTKRQQAVKDEILRIYKDARFDTPDLNEIWTCFPAKDKLICQQVLESLISGGGLVLIAPQIAFHAEAYEDARKLARDWFSQNETMTLAQYRDMLDTSRKYALALLEYYDRNKWTKKEGDYRTQIAFP